MNSLISPLFGLVLSFYVRAAFADGVHPQKIQVPPAAGCPRVPALKDFVDTFSRADYRLERGFDPQKEDLSTLLRLTYIDGVTIDLDFNTIDDHDVDVTTVSRQLHNAHWGPKCRLFPERLNQRTTPNLYSAKQEALRTIHESIQSQEDSEY